MKRSRRRRRRILRRMILGLSTVLLVLIIGIFYFELRPVVAKEITVEAGDKGVRVEDFLKHKKQKGRFITDIESLNTSITGNYEVKILVGNKTHTSVLKVVDTVAPVITLQDYVALRGEEVDPKSFVKDIADATQVDIFFEISPDTSKPGEQEAVIICKDGGGNTVSGRAGLTVLDVRSSVTMEAGSKMSLTSADFVNDSSYDIAFVTDLSTLDISKPGVYPIEFTVNGKLVTGHLEVVDTIPPKATVKAQETWTGEKLEAMELLENITDASKVTADYKTQPNWDRPGVQAVILVLTDEAGNVTELPASLTVVADTEPPVIKGALDKTVYIGNSVSYRKGVTVTDNKDGEVSFEVDSNGVNLKKEGEYKVTYTAVDSSGNVARKDITVRVKTFTVAEEKVNELCDEILDKITNSSMSQREVAYEIYKWARQNISYTGDSDKSDWLAEAYRGMTDKKGDCFTYFAVSQAMLIRVGIENMEINRVGGNTRHYWSLINCGDGWYHFDSCPNKDHEETFMMTDKEVDEFTQKRGNNYYTYDRSLYPATPEQ
ncbi:hypothetical protein HNQ56_004114 [Anaerotaenia torta]|uniref:transglutaminase domain-containing protein n=1 Tax=Anaerotaenia torta TaxID=433293 RepID=UPI003D209331